MSPGGILRRLMISQRRLEIAFPRKGKKLRDLIKGRVKPDQYKSVQCWIEQCYNPPSYQEQVELAINEVLEGYGVEAIFKGGRYPEVVYINLGDTYTTTLVYDYSRERWYLTSWGDYVERRKL